MHHQPANSAAVRTQRPSHVVHLKPGETVGQARVRWERATGRRGILFIA